MTLDRDPNPFPAMSPDERARYGEPEEWRTEGYVGPRNRSSDTAQFSLRLPRSEFRALRSLAERREVSFSDVVRDALARYLADAGRPRLTNVTIRISSREVGLISSEQISPDRTAYRTEPSPEVAMHEPQAVTA